MKIAIVRERTDGETRVAATPETVTKLIGLGASVSIERGAGATARFPDADYEKAGATLGTGAEVMKLFLRLREEGQTIFMVTHDAAIAAHADRIVHLRDGRLED